MKILGGSSQQAPSKSSANAVDTLIGRQTEIQGDVRFSGGLYVDGTIKGKVIAGMEKSATLTLSETGAIEGDVRVPTIVLNGSVTGDVYAADKITLAAKARVTGNVYYKVLEMQGGAQVNGQLVHDKGGAPAALTHQNSEKDNVRQDINVLGTPELRRAAG